MVALNEKLKDAHNYIRKGMTLIEGHDKYEVKESVVVCVCSVHFTDTLSNILLFVWHNRHAMKMTLAECVAEKNSILAFPLSDIQRGHTDR